MVLSAPSWTPLKMGWEGLLIVRLMVPAVSGMVLPVVKPRRLLRIAYPPRTIMGAEILFQAVAAASW